MDPFDTFFVGRTLNERWEVTARRHVIHEAPSACRTYDASGPDNEVVIVKVLVPELGASLEEQRRQIDEFLYEIAIVDRCGERNLRRVLRALDAGRLAIPGTVPITVHYLVLEWADRDLRSFQAASDEEHLAASLRFLHEMATALHELHFSRIVHQNLAPTNVLCRPDGRTKLGGFSHARSLDQPRPYGDVPLDQTRAPPEILYGGTVNSFEDRCAVDMYHLGCLGCYLLTNAGTTVQLERRLPHLFHWTIWRGSFADVLPYLRVAHETLVRELEPAAHAMVRVELVRGLAQLTDPDPARRGHPRNLAGNGPRFGFERYISLFIRLARQVEFHLLKRVS